MEQDLRRLRLRVAAKLMLALGFFTVLYVVLSVLLHSDPESRVVPTQIVDIRGMQAGELRMELWQGRPVLIYLRTDEQLKALAERDLRLRDADSARSRQPSWAINALRSREGALFVSIGVGTDFSCPIKLLPAADETFMGRIWGGGFVDECRGARYDFSGRVFSGQYADENLIVPEYRLDDGLLVLGG